MPPVALALTNNSYVCMFTAAWSLCPVAAFLNNILEIRGDAFKMMYGLQRPVPTFDAYAACLLVCVGCLV